MSLIRPISVSAHKKLERYTLSLFDEGAKWDIKPLVFELQN
jgi:hypothetical protein